MTDSDPSFTEPTPIPCLFVSGTAIEFTASFARIVAWTELPGLPDEPHERRIIARLVLPEDVARDLQLDLVTGLLKSRS